MRMCFGWICYRIFMAYKPNWRVYLFHHPGLLQINRLHWI